YPEQARRRRDLRAGPQVRGHGTRPGDTPAELRRATTRSRYWPRREAARRIEGRKGRTVSRGDRGGRVPGGGGDARARQDGELGRKACLASAGRPVHLFPASPASL